MARNRIIKPEFWSNEKVARLSLGSRLLFIGMWNFADDYGILLNSDKRLMGDIFPVDDKVSLSDIKKWKNEIIKEGLILPIIYKEQNFYYITGWNDHQIVDNPAKRRWIDEKDFDDIIKSSLGSHESLTRVSLSNDNENDNDNDNENESGDKSPTPKMKMEEFINSVKTRSEAYGLLIDELSVKFPHEKLVAEFDKFVDYWTELNPKGTKQRWRAEKFFDVRRRLQTWFERIKPEFSAFSKPTKTAIIH